MAKLYNQKTNALLCELTAPQLQFLIDQLEEEDSKDQDYYIDRNTIAMMREKGGDPDLLSVLESAISADAGDGDDSPGVDVIWKD